MRILVSAVSAAAVAWVALPWVSMAVRGTIDRCALDALRREVTVPAPRTPADDAVSRPAARA